VLGGIHVIPGRNHREVLMKPMRWVQLVLVLWLVSGGTLEWNAASAASRSSRQSATITRAEIEQALQVPPKTGIKDVALRVVSVKGDYNVGVFAVRRTPVNGEAVPDAYQHHEVTEIYNVVSGSGTLVTGGTLEQASEIRQDDPSVMKLMGPTAQGVAIRGGTSQQIGPGDVVVIPANTPHGFTQLGPEGISYVVMRVDPHRLLPLR
jgi:mannose-6-phosphate isomerase-like protein (cupin superfamily)